MSHQFERGFAPIIIIAVVAVLAIGGGVYYVKKGKTVEVESEISTEVYVETGDSKTTFRSLLAIGRDVMCEFSSQAGGVSSEGTVYVTSDGKMRGDFTSVTTQGDMESHMIMDTSAVHLWSGAQGTKVSRTRLESGVETNTETNQSVDLDAEVQYDCDDWTRDNSKFTLPSGVNFIDIEALMNTQFQAS